MLYFRDFDIGQPVGRCALHADPAVLRPNGPGAARSGPLSRADLLALLMRGYCGIVTPRPPGNIHAGQSIRFLAGARFGDMLDMSLACIDKTERNERMWLRLAAAVHRGRTRIMEADMTFIWAA